MSESKKDYELDAPIGDDFTLDDIEDMPGFVTPPTGAYVVLVEKGIEAIDINDDPYLTARMNIVSVEEVHDAALSDGEERPKIGDMFSILFNRQNKFAMSNFKVYSAPIIEQFKCKTVSDVMEASKGVSLLVIVKRTYDKKKDRHNIQIPKTALV